MAIIFNCRFCSTVRFDESIKNEEKPREVERSGDDNVDLQRDETIKKLKS